jgi:hypothetical protein
LSRVKTIIRCVIEAADKKLDKKLPKTKVQNTIDDDDDFVKLGNEAAELYLQMISDAKIH